MERHDTLSIGDWSCLMQGFYRHVPHNPQIRHLRYYWRAAIAGKPAESRTGFPAQSQLEFQVRAGWEARPTGRSASPCEPLATSACRVLYSKDRISKIGLAAGRWRAWRNWQTRKIQVLVSVRTWRFNSSCPHLNDGFSKKAGEESLRRKLAGFFRALA